MPSLDRIRILVPDGPEVGTLEQPAMQVYVYTLSFGSLCAHRSVNPQGNASAYTPAKPETVATPDPAVRPTAGRRVTRCWLATRHPLHRPLFFFPASHSPGRNWLRFSGSIRPWLVISQNMRTTNTTDTASELALFWR